MRLPSVLDEIVLDFLHPDETKEALLVLSIKDPSLQNWEDWKWNAKRQVMSYNGDRTDIRIDGILHSKTHPARVWGDGSQDWYWKGNIHKDKDQPARIYANGTLMWFLDGKRHRDPTNDLPAIIDAVGGREWYVNGKQHRAGDQPAVMDHGVQEWFKEGKLHRDNGLPAVVMDDGRREVWKNGNFSHQFHEAPQP